MKNILFLTIILCIFSFATFASGQIPCVACDNEHAPVCARSTKTGELKTFQNSCAVDAQDCGHYEHRKFAKFGFD